MKGVLAQLFFVLAGVAAVAALWRAARLLGLATRTETAVPGDGLQPLPLAADDSPRDAELVRLHDERRRLLAHLREIQFDFETGKIDARDHAELNAKYEQEALAVLRALDAYGNGQHAQSEAPREADHG